MSHSVLYMVSFKLVCSVHMTYRMPLLLEREIPPLLFLSFAAIIGFFEVYAVKTVNPLETNL